MQQPPQFPKPVSSVPSIQTNFAFLKHHNDQLLNLGILAERYFPSDPNTCLLKLRQLAELFTQHLAARAGIYTSTEENQYDLLIRLQNNGLLQREVYQLFHEIRRLGNAANHALTGDHSTALSALKITWQIGLWFHRTFKDPKFKSGPFVPPAPPKDQSVELKDELHRLQTELDKYRATHTGTSQLLSEIEAKARAASDEKSFWESLASETEQQNNALKAELAELQKQAAAQLKASLFKVATAATKAATFVQLDEAATRKIIDAQLRAAGWEAESETLRYAEGARPEKGRNKAIAEWPVFNQTTGRADYVLFVGNTPLAVVEAKRGNIDVSGCLEQAKGYSADILPSEFVQPGGPWQNGKYKIPFAYSANGRPFLKQLSTKSGIWFCDLRRADSISRPLDGWPSPEGLQAEFLADAARAHAILDAEGFNYGFALRYYQRDAIRALERGIAAGRRSMLLAMATGTGKTKTCIALVYRLLKAKRFRRILFLVDRSALGKQAGDAFKDTRMENLQTFADTFGLKDLEDQTPDADTAVHISTVQAMVQRVLYCPDGATPPPGDRYDCIVVDECHRGYLMDRELSESELTFRGHEDYISKYSRVLTYFDAVKIGLTATPALHTSELFSDGDGAREPIYTYGYRNAVIDGYLVDYEPPYQIKTDLSVQGIKWNAGDEVKYYEAAKSQIALFKTPDELAFEVDEFNRKVITENFNRTVCEELARQIDPTAGLKTLIFCVNDQHADLVVTLLKQAFEKQYGSVEEDAVLKITGAATKPLQLIRRFKNERNPNVAVTVDLLTTGIDVPEIGNLVFLRRVNSRILFDQMIGRATRLCPEHQKESFKVFDAVRIFEALDNMTAMKPVVANPQVSFKQMADELAHLSDAKAAAEVLDQFIAKLQRKKRFLTEDALHDLEALAIGYCATPDELINHIRRALRPEEVKTLFASPQGQALAAILDGRPSDRNPANSQDWLISEHPDQLQSVERGYGKAQKPSDYLNEFTAFIRDNQDRIPALVTVLTRPRDLTRKQLRELMLELGKAGYTETNLETAWRQTTNQDMAARIVGYIRHVASQDPLIPYAERVDRALYETLRSRDWTNPQREWLKKIAAQTKANVIVDLDAIDDPDLIFKREGGGSLRLDRIFEGKLSVVLQSFNEALWRTAGAAA